MSQVRNEALKYQKSIHAFGKRFCAFENSEHISAGAAMATSSVVLLALISFIYLSAAGCSRTNSTQNPTTTKPGTEKWSLDLGSPVDVTNLFAKRDGTILIRTKDKLLIIDKDGNKLQSYSSGTTIGDDGTVYVIWSPSSNILLGGAPPRPKGASRLYALSKDGKERWHYNPGGPFLGPIATFSDIVYFADNERVFARRSNGVELWTYPAKQVKRLEVGPDGSIYLGMGEKIIALRSDGKKMMEYIGANDWATADQGLYLKTSEFLISVALNGAKRWQVPISGIPSDKMAVLKDGSVFLGGQTIDGYSISIISPQGVNKRSIRSGDELSYGFGKQFYADSRGNFYYGAATKRSSGRNASTGVYSKWTIHVLDPGGREKWRLETSVTLHPDGRYSLGESVDGKHSIFTAKLPDGRTKWTFMADGLVTQSPIFGPDGTLYIGTTKKLYAVNP